MDQVLIPIDRDLTAEGVAHLAAELRTRLNGYEPILVRGMLGRAMVLPASRRPGINISGQPS